MFAHNGKLYARVSDILKPFVNFDGIDKIVLQNKAELGTEVHNAIEHIIKGEPLPHVVSKGTGYVKSFHKWMIALGPRFLKSEERYYCDDFMITGRIDTLIKIEGEDEALLVDFKTSVQESPTWVMQAHLYYYLIQKKELSFPISKRFVFLKLDRHGSLPKVFEYKYSDLIHAKCMQAIDSFWERINVAVNL
jgi:hypothetical protein